MFIVFMAIEALTIAMVMVDGKVVLPGVRGVEAGCSRGEVKILVRVATINVFQACVSMLACPAVQGLSKASRLNQLRNRSVFPN